MNAEASREDSRKLCALPSDTGSSASYYTLHMWSQNSPSSPAPLRLDASSTQYWVLHTCREILLQGTHLDPKPQLHDWRYGSTPVSKTRMFQT